MCGIVGFTGLQDRITLERMNEAIMHRGPDSSGFYENPNVSLGMRRLAIVDLNTGEQPFYSEDKDIVVVFNGEIYNHSEIRRQLERQGHSFSTDHCDGEIIGHAFQEYGVDWPNFVNGMFAAAIWDNHNRELYLYRDRLGKKPLYYTSVNDKIIFASELKSLFANPIVRKEVNFEALGFYFSGKNTAAPQTAFINIFQVMPGSFVKWTEAKGTSTHRYWKADFAPNTVISEVEAADTIYHLLEDAVKIRMQCDVPFGAYLSGGVDSTSVVSIMSKNHSRPVKTFCLGYNDQEGDQFIGKNQDVYYARKMAKEIGTEHYEMFISAKEFADSMEDVISAFDEPFSGTVSTYFLTQLISKHVKVAISGDGADELFASYLPQRLSFPIEYYIALKDIGKDHFIQLSDAEKAKLAPYNDQKGYGFLQSIASENVRVWRDKLSVFTTHEKKLLLNKEWFNEKSLQNPFLLNAGGLTGRDLLSHNLEIDQNDLLPNQILPFVDRLSMAHSVEVRCPFLDYRMVEFVNNLPGHYKINNGINKYILKKAVSGILPENLISRPKEGFVQPIYTWMHSSLKDWINELIASLPTELFNMEYVQKLSQRFNSGDSSLNAKIWNLACFSIWWENI